MARNVYGLDLGTYEIKVFEKKTDRIWREKNVIAMKDKRYVFATGNKAYEMYEKSPDNIQVVFPMKNGVIAHFDDMQFLLCELLESARQSILGAEYVIAVPTDVTEVEKKAFYDLVFHSEARAKSVKIVERGLADAIGAGIHILDEKGVFVANFGDGTTELSVLSKGGMVMNRLVKTGGSHLDQSIMARVRHNREFLIGRLTAEKLRKEFGVLVKTPYKSLKVAGRDLQTGVPSQDEIPVSLVRSAMKEPLDECIRSVRIMLDRTPPDVRRAISTNGICLTGGAANLKGLSTYLERSIGLPVVKAEEPELCSVKGLRKIISDKSYYKRLTYSMLGEDYRWLR